MTACDVISKIGLDFVYPSSRQGSVFFMSSLKCIDHCSQGAWITVLYLNLEQAYFATPENQWAVMKV